MISALASKVTAVEFCVILTVAGIVSASKFVMLSAVTSEVSTVKLCVNLAITRIMVTIKLFVIFTVTRIVITIELIMIAAVTSEVTAVKLLVIALVKRIAANRTKLILFNRAEGLYFCNHNIDILIALAGYIRCIARNRVGFSVLERLASVYQREQSVIEILYLKVVVIIADDQLSADLHVLSRPEVIQPFSKEFTVCLRESRNADFVILA